MFGVALMPVDHIDQMSPHVFAGWNAADLVRGVGQKSLELSAELALAIDNRGTRPIGRWCWLFGGGTFEVVEYSLRSVERPEVASG